MLTQWMDDKNLTIKWNKVLKKQMFLMKMWTYPSFDLTELLMHFRKN